MPSSQNARDAKEQFEAIAGQVFGAYGHFIAARIALIDSSLVMLGDTLSRAQPYLGGRLGVEWRVTRGKERELKGQAAIDEELPRLPHGVGDLTPSLVVWKRGGVVRRRASGNEHRDIRLLAQTGAFWTRRTIDPIHATRRVRSIGDFKRYHATTLEAVGLTAHLIIERRRLLEVAANVRRSLVCSRLHGAQSLLNSLANAKSLTDFARAEISETWWSDERQSHD